MWKEKLEEIKKLNIIFGEEINDGATEQDIELFLEKIGNKVIESALQEYIPFLKSVNVFEFNGFILYGIDSDLLTYIPKQQINGFIDNNEVWNENDWQKSYLFLGDSSDSWYVYDLDSKKYNELNKPSGDIVEMYDDIDALLDKVLGDALG